MNRNIFLVILISGLITSSLHFEAVAGESKPDEKLTTIKYVFEPFRTFMIEGTNLKGVQLDALTSELTKYKASHQDELFELWAEVKVTPEESAKIIEAIQKAGITLKHFWAPRSFVDSSANIGPYGSAHEDILKKQTNSIIIADAPPAVRRIDTFKTLKEDASIIDIARVVGNPDKEVGSGISIFVYNMNDGTEVWIGAVELNKPPVYILHILKDGRREYLFKR